MGVLTYCESDCILAQQILPVTSGRWCSVVSQLIDGLLIINGLCSTVPELPRPHAHTIHYITLPTALVIWSPSLPGTQDRYDEPALSKETLDPGGVAEAGQQCEPATAAVPPSSCRPSTHPVSTQTTDMQS